MYFGIICMVLFFITGCAQSNSGIEIGSGEDLVVKDGNVLFYNDPVAVCFNKNIYAAFVNRRGGCLSGGLSVRMHGLN